MARNAVKKATSAVQQAPGEAPPLKGGTLGMPGAQPRASALPAGMVGSARRRDAGPVGGRQYEVIGGPDMVTYPNQGKVRLLRGKVISDSSVDIELLKRQGVKLQDVTPPPPEPEPAVEEEGEKFTEDPPSDDE